MKARDFFDGWMVDEYGWYRSYCTVSVKTAWGETQEGRFVKGLDTCFFKTLSGVWLNYEPHQVESYKP